MTYTVSSGALNSTQTQTLSGVRCRLAYDPADATATHCLLLQIGFSFLVPAHSGSPGKRAVKRMCVCVCVCVCYQLGDRQVISCWPLTRACGRRRRSDRSPPAMLYPGCCTHATRTSRIVSTNKLVDTGVVAKWINYCAAQPLSLQFPTVIPLGHAPTQWTLWSSVSSGRLIFITRLLFYQSYWHCLTSCAFYC